MRLIDADALEEYGQTQIQIVPQGNGAYTEMRVYYQNDIDIAPTVQAIPFSVLKDIRQDIANMSRFSGDNYFMAKQDAYDVIDRYIKEYT